jgi:hypothetical protein
MEDQTIVVQESPNYLMPVMTMQAVIQRRAAVVEFTKSAMKRGVDFGVIPGTGDKPTLLKPGAEKLCTLFGLSPRFAITNKIEDWNGRDYDDEPMFYYTYKCGLWYQDHLVAEAEGSCNSHEKKYRYRQGERKCPTCGKAAIIKGKAEYGGGWLCFGKKGGCGAKFPDGDTAIESQQVGQVLNPDTADQVNTIQKMAQKRALIAATLLAVNASEFFTQDLDDMAIEHDMGPTWTEPTGAPTMPKSAAQNGAQPSAIEWPSKLLNGLVMHFKGGSVHEYRARLNKSSVLKPDDDIKVIIHWNDIYNVERTNESIDPDEAARRADADRQATMESA